MRNKDYRELQLSSSLLIFIFLAIIILGIIIFLLGVSVGKKQVQLAATTQLTPEDSLEKVTQDKPKPVKESADPISKEIEAHQEAQKQVEKIEPPTVKPATKKSQTPAQKKEEPPAKKPAPPQTGNLFYIQVGAYSSQQSADSVAERYRSMGYSCRVFPPQPSAQSRLYRVRIGGYATRAQALEERARLADRENKSTDDYFIVQR